jgi:hypothetical protein
MDSLNHFFPDSTLAPPEQVQAPQDAGLVQRVHKLVQFATRNGPSFVELIKKKQKVRISLLKIVNYCWH